MRKYKSTYLFELIEWIYSYIPWVIGSYFELLPKMVNKDASRFFLSMSYCAATLKCKNLWSLKLPLSKYRIVVGTNTCDYSENQIFCFLKSRILMCQFFFRKKSFLFVLRSLGYSGYLTNTSCQVAGISKRSDNFYFLTPHVTNWINLN